MFRCCNENCSLLHSDCKNKHALSPVKDQGYKKNYTALKLKMVNEDNSYMTRLKSLKPLN